MKINSFTAKGVHGYLDFDIKFFPDLTFLIGINGSGKTSALKLILGLTSPSYNYLNQITFTECKVECVNIEKDEKTKTERIDEIIIEAKISDNPDIFNLFLTLNGELLPSQDFGKVYRNTFRGEIDDNNSIEQRNKDIFDTSDVVKKIRAMATPKYLGLDRRIYEGKYIDARLRRWGSGFTRKFEERFNDSTPINISLQEVQILVFDYIRGLPQQQYKISDKFKEELFLDSFKFIEEINFNHKPNISVLNERKENVRKAIDELGMRYLHTQINQFFDEMTKLTVNSVNFTDNLDENQKSLDLLLKWMHNSLQLKRIDSIIDFSKDYQQSIAELRAPINKLENIVSKFLAEGGKKLSIQDDGEIQVILNNGDSTSIYELSSGEKQIIIMIAHLIFEEDRKPSGIFIIDEPELSLHLAWQEIFVDSITEASPKTQFVLATHSPSIIAKVNREEFCQDLSRLHNA